MLGRIANHFSFKTAIGYHSFTQRQSGHVPTTSGDLRASTIAD